MRFIITLQAISNSVIPISYQYPLSSAIYKIISTADSTYAAFLHTTGYGKGFKLFCFSDLRGKFTVKGDRLLMANDKASLEISFHLPEASQSFIKGLFLSQSIEIADKRLKAGGDGLYNSMGCGCVEQMQKEKWTF